MLRISVPLIAAIGAISATAAYAASAVGSVTAVDETAHTVTLSDDVTYTTSPTMDLHRIQVGYTIRLSFTKEDTVNKVSTLEIISPAQPTGY